ncbi:hypothetical protein RJ641_012256 [Dillenia turbinata]|uniref:Uncharacterized protein n=1 Tax=Dillenia turbinata TaxID=194707 RepID=A0AAN8Z0C1_9MAGN
MLRTNNILFLINHIPDHAHSDMCGNQQGDTGPHNLDTSKVFHLGLPAFKTLDQMFEDCIKSFQGVSLSIIMEFAEFCLLEFALSSKIKKEMERPQMNGVNRINSLEKQQTEASTRNNKIKNLQRTRHKQSQNNPVNQILKVGFAM